MLSKRIEPSISDIIHDQITLLCIFGIFYRITFWLGKDMWRLTQRLEHTRSSQRSHAHVIARFFIARPRGHGRVHVHAV